MNIPFISIAWPAPGNRNLYSDLMDEFVLQGHMVHVAGTHHKSSEGKLDLNEENGIRVLRIHSWKIMKTSYLRKALSLLTLGEAYIGTKNP